MRLDKYLKVSRIIKRRTVANEACDAGKVEVNDKIARASYDIKVGDIIKRHFDKVITVQTSRQCDCCATHLTRVKTIFRLRP